MKEVHALFQPSVDSLSHLLMFLMAFLMNIMEGPATPDTHMEVKVVF